MKYILVATKNQDACETIRKCFDTGFQVETASNRVTCLEMLSLKRYEFLFIDVDLIRDTAGENEYKKQLQPFWSIFPEAEIIVMTSPNAIRQAVNAVKAGASNFLAYPIDSLEVNYIIESIHRDQQLYSELKYLRNQFWRRESFSVLRTKSPLVRAVFDEVRSVAPTDSTVLLTGETGTGKGMIATLIHRHSRRSEKQFIQVHCGAIPDTLLESELFGHEKGAFTGADRRKLGKFEIAHGGTIFLDEIGTISASMQIKLLQILQDKTFQRVGGEATLRADVRIILATNADLKKMCEEGSFRTDLYYRLHVFPIEVPPLRERKEDIPLLVEIFLERLNRFSLKHIIDVDSVVIEALQVYDWPGNIRELENLIERAYIIETSSVLTPQSFPKELFVDGIRVEPHYIDVSIPLEKARQNAIESFEKEYLMELLMKNKGKVNRTAVEAGVGPRQLHKLMKKYGIHKEDFKKQDRISEESDL
ncbi:MAG: sigma-54 dependent transcriptional regulator [bacterium]